ncbi:hypothetical protein CEXT_319381, partial [Caerostris extrusa]
MVGIRGI